MSKELYQQQCQACTANSSPVSPQEATIFLQEIPNWEIVNEENIQRLQRVFLFGNFIEAMQFADKITTLAEEQNHHPLLCIEWGKVRVQWWTHVIKGLHINDFILAAQCDRLKIPR